MIPEFIICPVKRLYAELNENLPDGKTVAILLTTEEINHPSLNLLDAYLRICVMDTESEEKEFSFSHNDGIRVKEFLEKDDSKRIYICCDSGESRSTAMTAAIMRYYGLSDKTIWKNPHYHPNLLVYKKQMNAFGFKVNRLKLKFLKYLSDSALKKEIRRSRK